MGKYFVEPYKTYNEKLKGASGLASSGTSLTSSVSSSNSALSGISSSIPNAGWEELGIEEIANSTIPNIITNVGVLLGNFGVLSKAASIATGSLLPETDKLKSEDEKLDEIINTLNTLTIPVQFDGEGNETLAYREYSQKKAQLEKDKAECEKNCLQFQRNCDSYASSIKALDSSVQELKKPTASSGTNKISSKVSVIESVEGGKLLKVRYTDGREFYMINSRITPLDYEKYVQKYKLYQNAGVLDGLCPILSQYYAMDMMRGTYTTKSQMVNLEKGPSTRVKAGVSSANMDDILAYIYNEAVNGRETTLQVTQKNTPVDGSRHVVTVVGFDTSVKSYKDLNPDTIWVMDCVDGKIQTLSQARANGGHERKLYNQGGKYLAHGATDDFLNLEVYNEEWQRKHGQTGKKA